MDINEIGKKAKVAAGDLAKVVDDDKHTALLEVARVILRQKPEILAANAKDIEAAIASGMHEGMVDRLRLDDARIASITDGIVEVAAHPDPLFETIGSFERPNGLIINKVTCPIGVVGIIYESRPNVTADAFALCFRSGNACVLRGGSDAINTNMALTKAIRTAMETSKINPDVIQLIEDTDRDVAKALMKCNEYIDLLIPRGSESLIKTAVENSTVPIIETGTGNCHIFVDSSAEIPESVRIIVNAKTQRIGVCNACESLLVHRNVYEKIMPLLWDALNKVHPVEIRGDEDICRVLPEAVPVTEEDYYKEYLDYILSVKVVDSVDEAIAHINKYGTHHSDAILTDSLTHARRFQKEVDSACVYVNASTRFTDGYEFGFGGEIGISTQKLHARGPMGLRELTTYKYIIDGDWQVRG